MGIKSMAHRCISLPKSWMAGRLFYRPVPIFEQDSEEDIIERVKAQEHAIYHYVEWFISGRLTM